MEDQQATSGQPPKAAPKGRTLWIAVAVIVVVVVVLLAAVLGGLFTPATSNLRIGSVLSLTGSLDDFGPGNTKGVQLAVDQINAAGGVLGRPVELFSEDDQTLPAAASAATTKLITTNRVNAIVGAQFSGGTIASLTVAKTNGVPMVSPSATSPSLSNLTLTDGWFFRTTPNDNLQGVVAAQYLFTNRSFRHINIMNINDPYGNGLAGVLKAKFIALGGTVNVTVPINPAATTFTGELAQLFSQDPQAVYFVAFTNEGFTVLKEWQAGLVTNPSWNRPWVLAEGMRSQVFLDQLRTSAGVDVTQIEGTAPITGFGNVYAIFEQQYKAKFFNQTPVLYTDNSYDAAYVIALAAQKAGAVDGASIKRELRNVATPPGTVIKPGEWAKAVTELAAGRDIDWEGAAGSENFDANGDVTGPYEIWGANSTFQLVRKAFIPESLIQPAPPAPFAAPSLPLSSQFLVKVQAIGSSRWD
jgi:ABC-type branched-subunit amino acid transport system substrate-binding protein